APAAQTPGAPAAAPGAGRGAPAVRGQEGPANPAADEQLPSDEEVVTSVNGKDEDRGETEVQKDAKKTEGGPGAGGGESVPGADGKIPPDAALPGGGNAKEEAAKEEPAPADAANEAATAAPEGGGEDMAAAEGPGG